MAIAHAISSMCSFCVESSPSPLCLTNSYSSFKAHPKFLLPVPELSPVSLAEWDTSPQSSHCTMSLTYLSPHQNHWCLCLPLTQGLWGYGWGKHLNFLPLSSHLFFLLLEWCPKLTLELPTPPHPCSKPCSFRRSFPDHHSLMDDHRTQFWLMSFCPRTFIHTVGGRKALLARLEPRISLQPLNEPALWL